MAAHRRFSIIRQARHDPVSNSCATQVYDSTQEIPYTFRLIWPNRGSKWNVTGAATIRLYTSQEELLRDLVAGRLDAIFGDGLGSHAWLEGPKGSDFALVGEGYRLDEGIGIAVRKEDTGLLRRLNEALRAILSDGTCEKINARYFPFSIYGVLRL